MADSAPSDDSEIGSVRIEAATHLIPALPGERAYILSNNGVFFALIYVLLKAEINGL